MRSALSGVYPTRSSVAPSPGTIPKLQTRSGAARVAGLRFTFLATDETIGAAVGQAFLDIFLRGRGRQNQEVRGKSLRRIQSAAYGA